MKSTANPKVPEANPAFLEALGAPLRRHLQRAVLGASLLALVGCSSLQVVMEFGSAHAPAPASVNRLLAPNDALTVTKVDGTQLKLHLTSLSGTSLDGVDDQTAAKVSIPLGEITRIERREFDGLKTAFLVVAIAAGVYALAAAAGSASWASTAAL
jgi:hypothetical protein